MNFDSFKFLLEKEFIFDINALYYFKYLHLGFKRFCQSVTKKMMKGLDFQNWVSNGPFNQIT